MKKMPYTFSVLRYIHDVVSGEFVNVGVALYAPEAQFLGAACASTYGRLSAFFGGIESEHFKRMMRHITAGIEELAERLNNELSAAALPADIKGWIDQVLPPDDSSLQFSPIRGGLTEDPPVTLEELYERFVERYARRVPPPSRSDDEILRGLRDQLAKRHVLTHLQAKKITGPHYEHEFPLAWKNRIWHTSEAISFDLTNSGSILEKANQWLGRVVSLSQSPEPFKVYLLLGKPRLEKLKASFERARHILDNMPCAHEFIGEENTAAFADRIQNELSRYNQQD